MALTSGAGEKTPAGVNSTGDALLFATRGGGPAGGRGAGGGGGGGRGGSYSLLSIAEQTVTPLNTTDRPSFSGDGKSLSFVARDGDAYQVIIASTSDPTKTAIAHKGPERVEATALSPDGSRVAFQMMPRDDWEIYVANRDGSGEQRLTREIQHDLLPQFLSSTRLLAVVGEARHRRSYLYDLTTGARTRLFHNNTVRTIAPSTVDAEHRRRTDPHRRRTRRRHRVARARRVRMMDLTRKVTPAGGAGARCRGSCLRKGPACQGAADLRTDRGRRQDGRRRCVGAARLRLREELFDFDSKHITKPGNNLASAYLFDTYKSFGYQPELSGSISGRRWTAARPTSWQR